jgi:hypothetical protein
MENTKQEGLNALVEKKIQAKLAKGMTNVQTATARLMEEHKISRDSIVDIGTEKRGIESSMVFKPVRGTVGANIKLRDENNVIVPEDCNFNPYAVRQVAEKLKIPTAYLTYLLFNSEQWQQNLGYEILNTHNGYLTRNKVLVRLVGQEVRAVLSDQYRRLNSQTIFSTHIEEVFANGGQLSDGFMDDTRVMIESIYPKPIEIQTSLNGMILVAFGTRVDSSDYGAKALSARSFIMQGVCLNGMVSESILREVHLGAKLPENIGLSQETYRLDTLATASAIKDITHTLYSSEVITDRCLQIQSAADTRVDPSAMLTSLQGLGKLMKGEADEVGKILMRSDVMDGLQGESSLWKLTQGISAFANGEGVDPIRRLDLQEIAGELLKKAGKN